MNEAFDPIEGPNEATSDPFAVAAIWHGRFEEREPGATELERFEAWLSEDPCHRAAYQSVARSWAGMANAGFEDRILLMRREALAAPPTARARWLRPTGIAAAVLAAALMIGALLHLLPHGTDSNATEFVTQIGQRSSITLADGSTVVLDTASRIQVLFDAQVRRVELLAGQAWFEVAKNQPQPFIVEAGGRRVTAHGTAFDVRLDGPDQVQITLIEGRVSVEALKAPGADSASSADRVDLLPGDQLLAGATRPATKRKTDVAKATSWREGQLIFDDDTLTAAVAEVNRYSTKKIVLADPRLGALRMSGVFIAGHSESFLETLVGHFPIKVAPDSDGQWVLTPTH